MGRSRRLKALIAAGSIASALLAPSAAGAQTYPNQVPLVSGPDVTGLTPEDIQTLFAINPEYTAQDQAATYPQSVASGDPQRDAAGL